MELLALLAEVAVLWIISTYVIRTIFTFLILLFPSRSVAVSVISAVVFPGTILHELSHLFTAEILGVRTGKINLVPEHIQNDEVQTGSVTFQSTDAVRRSLIGLAPLFWGMAAVTGIAWYLSLSIGEVFNTLKSGAILGHPSLYLALGGLYLVFTVSNTMFPSKIDLKGTPVVLGFLLLVIVCAYLIGLRIVLTGNSLLVAQTILQNIVQSLGLVITFNLALLLVMLINIRLMTRVLGVRLVRK